MGKTPLFVFAGGGTGGHLYPPLAVASAIRERLPASRIAFYCTHRSIDRRILESTGFEVIPQDVQALRIGKPWTYPSFVAAWIAARRACRRAFQEDRPAMVLGTGGFASGPPVVEAHRAGIPTALLNPDVIPGRANRYLASRSDAVFVQWDESIPWFRGHPCVRVTGCPVREDFRRAERAAGIAVFGLRPERKTLLVTGASLGARTINEAVVALRDELAMQAGWQILHISGTADHESVAAAYSDHPLVSKVVAFTDRMADALAAADLVVARAGASSLAEITALGRPAVLMPYPHHRDRHQEANASVLTQRGAARLVRDQANARENAGALGRELLQLMGDASALARMAEAARRLGQPDAAEVVAEAVLGLAREAGAVTASRG
ncbi:MAG: UDP-N-acetylglucosamine--N-acetylmuramyl-(pentapeptide) pyrophosphoryl-undecaprenol N-acetylglucosamine transferase [Phycisphaerae bacterium]|nr:UDP-N-acetylglucosamine--N-acetylmuramyl-(pentapeptide) pyrophosphoryl-undecaprenol N-acetylglucosamine transferase [Phycisphaerae bacterium]